MHLHWLIFVLVTMGWLSDAKDCSATEKAEAKKRLSAHLNLSNIQNPTMSPLIINYEDTNTTEDNTTEDPFFIYVDMYVTSITDVNEKAQSLTTQVRMITAWPDSKVTWEPEDFCGIYAFAAPRNMFWTPDIGIIESIKTDFGTKESPYVLLLNFSYIISSEIVSLTTACKMDLYRFPFDTQTCNITFQSSVYSVEDLRIYELNSAEWNTLQSKDKFQAQGEWDLGGISKYNASTYDLSELLEMDQLVHQITIKRRPHLYVINIIVPVFFFLMLDLISSFFDTSGSEKLSFKVTLLVSISVMLLILREMLPSTSRQIPLIGVFCGAVFCLMGISIAETILVNYLMVKGDEKRSVGTTADDSLRGQQNPPDSVRDQSLKQILSECWAATRKHQREKTCLSWTAVARIIHMIFLFLYLITVIVLLSVLGAIWI